MRTGPDGIPEGDRPEPESVPTSDPEPFESPETLTRFWCPGCDEEVNVSPESIGQLVRCPYCNTDFFASDEHSHDQVVDDTADDPVRDRQNEIDTLRVRTLSRRRMAVVRSASWWTIGLTVSGIAVLSFTVKAVRIAREDQRWGITPTVCMSVVCGAIWLARKCLRELAVAREEMKRHDLPEPSVPPDFSTLGNGRDRWKEFENIR